MTMTDPNDKMLDDLFAEARDVKPAVSNDLMARVLADANAVQQAKPADVTPRAPGFWFRFFDLVGGWPAIGTLTAATIAGLWFGVAPPAVVDEFAAGLTGDVVSVDLFSGADFLTGEGFADG